MKALISNLKHWVTSFVKWLAEAHSHPRYENDGQWSNGDM